ncbi:glutamate 5-kinase [Convivina intestini]|uniref:Glutamate 5-kinase n=1 Tax=Convivina intestini TaxID=1505726 RepID=A0A2U1D9D7_9LACO|nr:glutamate 5-kinase [Convivina intestini]PVY84304.1 glutamate 5-kinase [Convivina intestini]CAH1855463.1 Glutamate 5-kinase [Convivina intestini]SDB94103.1 glutamate 5-kinase [Leuconostocaceae bacterium R-53105]
MASKQQSTTNTNKKINPAWQRLVIKVGTSTIVDSDGRVKYPVINQLSQVIATLSRDGYQVILVTSGAIGVALDQLGLTKRPPDIPSQQALAALGQGYLMTIYNQSMALYRQKTGQVLLTYDVFNNPQMLGHMQAALEVMLDNHIVPIVNENDVIAVDEMDHQHSFGDNDKLAAMLALAVKAQGLIILSDVDGLYTANPNLDPKAQQISRVTKIDQAIRQLAGGSESGLGTGGMITKLNAAELMVNHQAKMVLIDGQFPERIMQIIADEPIGTRFQAEEK